MYVKVIFHLYLPAIIEAAAVNRIFRA